MRFGSIKAFLEFIQLLEGMGLKALYPLYEIEQQLKRLPDYVSMYSCLLVKGDNFLTIELVRNKEAWYSITLGDRPHE